MNVSNTSAKQKNVLADAYIEKNKTNIGHYIGLGVIYVTTS